MCIYLSILIKIRNEFLKGIAQLPPVATLWFTLRSGLKSVQTGFLSRDTKAEDVF